MTEVKNEALEALETACEKYLYGKAACKEIRTDSHVMADIIAYELRKEGYRIAPIAQPVADEKLREAVLQFKSSLNNMNVKADWFESWKTIEAALAELAALRAAHDDNISQEIDRLRLKAFSTNSRDDLTAYYEACSSWFQNRHYRKIAICPQLEDAANGLMNLNIKKE